MKVEPFRQTDTELVKQIILFRRRFCDPAQAEFAPIGGGQDDVGTLQGGQQRQCLRRRQRLSAFHSAG